MSVASPAPSITLDHLVVGCRTLDDGRAWCEATLGVAPAPGGRHALMGTHNLLLATGSVAYPRSYIELIAIDPEAPMPAHPRWFELDRAEVQARLQSGPRLLHWVARTDDIEAASIALREAGFDPGPSVAVERMTARGLLRWRIAITESGVRHGAGAVPLLIEWDDVHPADSLPASGVALRSVRIAGLGSALIAKLGVEAAVTTSPALVAELMAPAGAVTLRGA